MFSEDWVVPRLDKEQNLKLMSARQYQGRTSFWFTRKVKPCDGGGMRWDTDWSAEDFDIGGINGDPTLVTALIWAVGGSHDLLHHGPIFKNRGIEQTHVWEPSDDSEWCTGVDGKDLLPPGATIVPMINDPYEVDPTVGSTQLLQTYWKAPPGEHVLLGVRKKRDAGWKAWHHHTLLYGCTEVPEEDYSPKPRRSNDGCREIVFILRRRFR